MIEARRKTFTLAAVVMLALASLLGWMGGGESAHAQGRTYRMDPAASSLRVLVYRKGVLSVLAHDHVLVAKDYQGRIALNGADVAHASVTLRVSAGAWEVDAPEERKKAGFISELTDGNRKSILETLTGPEVLNVAKWPTVSAASERVTGTLPDLTVDMRVQIHGQEKQVAVPVKVTVTPGQVKATGSVALLQSDFGMTPYETLFGAIAVEDKIMVQFEIVAVPQS